MPLNGDLKTMFEYALAKSNAEQAYLRSTRTVYILSYTRVEVVNYLFVSYSVVWVLWRYTVHKQVPSLCHTNDVIATFVAWGGRMHLYAHLDKLGERHLYCDTISVILVQKDGEPPLAKCGDAMGDMTSELKKIECISEIVCGGPKDCAYKL